MTSLSPKLSETLSKVQSFMAAHVYPLEQDFLATHADQVFINKLNQTRTLVQQQGLWGLALGEELGGHGFTLYEFAHLAEELGRSPLAHYIFGCQAPDMGNIELIHLWGSPSQKENFLRPLVEGKIRSSFAMTEKNSAGSNPTLLQTRAVKVDGGYQISGEKWFTTGADGSQFTIVMAVSEEDGPPHDRATMFLVPTNTKGLHLVRNVPVMGQAGHGYFSHGELNFVECFVPDEYVLGTPGKGFQLAQDRLGPGRIHHGMRWIGICHRMLDLICKRVVRRSVSSEKTLGDSDVIRTWIAELKSSLYGARLMVLDAARKIVEHPEGRHQDEISMIKFHVARVVNDAVDKALQVHGALGMTDDTVISFFYREERAARIYDGPDEVHKLSLAKRILRAYE